MANYLAHEQEYLANDAIKRELGDTGHIRARTIARALGVSEGESNFISRTMNMRHGDPVKHARYTDQQRPVEVDEYYYHVTIAKNAPRIRRQGLQPNSDSVFTNYTTHTQGRIFLCDKKGVRYWKEKIANSDFHNTGRERRLAVVRVPKNVVSNIFVDKLGTEDSHAPSYYTTQPIPPGHLEFI